MSNINGRLLQTVQPVNKFIQKQTEVVWHQTEAPYITPFSDYHIHILVYPAGWKKYPNYILYLLGLSSYNITHVCI